MEKERGEREERERVEREREKGGSGREGGRERERARQRQRQRQEAETESGRTGAPFYENSLREFEPREFEFKLSVPYLLSRTSRTELARLRRRGREEEENVRVSCMCVCGAWAGKARKGGEKEVRQRPYLLGKAVTVRR